MALRTRLVVLAGLVTLICCGYWSIDTFWAPTSETIADSKIVFDHGPIADAALIFANDFTGKFNDTDSLPELREAVQARTRALTSLENHLATLLRSPSPQMLAITRQYYNISKMLMYEGKFDEAAAALQQSLTAGESASSSVAVQANLTTCLGICALRRGEVENCIRCVGPSSCIFPISRAAVHTNPEGSMQAIEYFTESLRLNPSDLRVCWLLNLAYMTLGGYPDKVPPRFLIPLDTFESTADVAVFKTSHCMRD